MRGMLATFAVLCAALIAMTAAGVEPGEMLADPVLETRARDISKNLRCLVCQNQSIDDSNAALARDLRIIVRERLAAGDSDTEVIDYVVARYGDFVLLKPPLKPVTYALWFGPVAIALAAAAAAAAFLRRRRTRPPLPLNPDERRRLEALLKDGSE
ncbi:MAG: cytochrome c-type biogenesis protein CcmH [Rhodospirillales bacterium]|nr:cytochrome c-type biogenesis protein CcmH [Rhodospirillales bacterium]